MKQTITTRLHQLARLPANASETNHSRIGQGRFRTSLRQKCCRVDQDELQLYCILQAPSGLSRTPISPEKRNNTNNNNNLRNLTGQPYRHLPICFVRVDADRLRAT